MKNKIYKPFEVRTTKSDSLMSNHKDVDDAINAIKQYMTFDNIFLQINKEENNNYYIYDIKTKERTNVKELLSDD